MTGILKNERLMKVLLAPRVTEKGALIGQHRQYIFKVTNEATKPEIKGAVELMFNVKVDGVQVASVKSKAKRSGRMMGWRKAWKKAYVTLAEGQHIDFGTA